jgi:hypothetical protein
MTIFQVRKLFKSSILFSVAVDLSGQHGNGCFERIKVMLTVAGVASAV